MAVAVLCCDCGCSIPDRTSRRGAPKCDACRKRRNGRPVARVEKTCTVCGRVFKHYARTVTCSPECRTQRDRHLALARHRANHPRREVECVCGIRFEPTHGRQLYCSPDCRPRPTVDEAERWARIKADAGKLDKAREKNRRAHRKRQRGTRRQRAQAKLHKAAIGKPVRRTWVMGSCVRCSEPFVASYATHHCSRKCQLADKADRHKAAKRAGFVERVFRAKLYERDNWHCQLCHKPVLMEKPVPHPLAPTLDHIVPLAVGGDHSYANTQLAHFICNSRKGAGPAQLRMVA